MKQKIFYWLNIFKHAGQIWVDSNAFAQAGSLVLLLQGNYVIREHPMHASHDLAQQRPL